MAQAFHKFFGSLIAMNRRVAIGGGVLGLILIAESSAALIGPFG